MSQVMGYEQPVNSLQFIDSNFPPQIAVVNVHWTRSIISDAALWQLFGPDLMKNLSSGFPQPADQVLQLLLHWVKSQNDMRKIQQTYAMRLRLEAFMHQYASHQTSIDEYGWRFLGVCNIGRSIAIRLNANLKLDSTAAWTESMLWDWRTSGAGNDEKVTCTIGVGGPELQLRFPLRDFKKSVLIFFVTGAYLWPSEYPVLENGMTTVTPPTSNSPPGWFPQPSPLPAQIPV